jgi:hypothetical protein
MNRKRSLPNALWATAAVIVSAVVLTKYVNYRISLAEVLVGSGPVIAARDLPTLLKSPSNVGERPTEGQAAITERTESRLLRYESRERCPAGRGNPVEIELLEGPRRGQVVWVCSDQIRMLHPLP